MIQRPQLDHLAINSIATGAGRGEVPATRSSDIDRLRSAIPSADAKNPALTAERADHVSVPKSVDLGSAIIESRGFIDELIRADTFLQVADKAFEGTDNILAEMRGIAELATDEGVSQFERAILDRDFQALKGDIDDAAENTEVDGEKILAGGIGPGNEYVIELSKGGEDGAGLNIGIPSMRVGDLSPGLVEANTLTRDAAFEAIKHTDIAINSVAARREKIAQVRQLVHNLLSSELAHNAQLIQIAATVDGAQFAAALSSHVSKTVLANRDDIPFEGSADRLRDILGRESQDDKPLVAAQVGAKQSEQIQPSQTAVYLTDEARDQARIEVLDVEVPKLRELDAMFQPPAQKVEASGASPHTETGGFMSELTRADDMLRMADSAIEQIDRQLGYMRDLAEESSTDSSRYRSALQEVFGVLKFRMIDTLAETTEVNGEKILAGGDGPDGAYVLQFSGGGENGQGLEIKIPSMRIENLSPDLAVAKVLTRDGASVALGNIDVTIEDVAQTREMITEQRTLIRQLMSAEAAENASPT